MSFDQVLDITMELPLEEREMLLDILSKRIAEEKRREIAEYSKSIKQEYQNGKLVSQPVGEIIKELEKDIEN